MLEPIFLSKNYSTILIWQSQLIFGSVIIKKKKKKKKSNGLRECCDYNQEVSLTY